MRHNQNRRARGRTNNRKGPNPLTRSYESNGPDVKVRGTAMHVAEKYMSLARDALSSGDNVAAENYLQHAEHYNRIVAAAQAQLRIDQPQQFRDGEEAGDEEGAGRTRDRFGYYNEPEFDENGEERFDMVGEDDGERPAARQQPQQQPRQDFRGQETRDGGQPRQDRGYNSDRARRDNQGDNRDPRPENRDNRNGYRADARNDGARNDGARTEGNRNEGNRNDGRGDNRNEFRGEYRNEGRNDNRRERYNGDRPRQDNRDGRNDEPVRMNGDYGRSEPHPARTEATIEPYTAEGAAAQEREFHEHGGPDRDSTATERTAPVDLTVPQDQVGTAAAPEAVQDEVAPRPRRRRAPRAAARTDEAENAPDAEGTADGAAALAAFPD